MLIKPKRLQAGDVVATVSPSWGGAGDPEIRWRYEQGVKRLEEVFGLTIIPMPNSLKGSEFIYNNPQARAEDLMTAFKDTRVKAIIANIGGQDSIRLLPHIDFNVIRENPKIFMGYSDVTISHLFCHKAGLSSLYGPAILTDFAENVEMDPYTVEMVNRTLFSNEVIGEIQPAPEWTSERLEWIEINKDTRRTMQQNNGYEVLQGSTTVQGRLIGGCIEVLEFAKGTELWPEKNIGRIAFSSLKLLKIIRTKLYKVLVTKLCSARHSAKAKASFLVNQKTKCIMKNINTKYCK